MTQITLKCPDCSGLNIKKNGIKKNKKQNYLCNDCERQFIGDHTLTYHGCNSELKSKIELMLVRGVGIRDIAEIEKISIVKVLSVLTNSDKLFTPKQNYYDAIEIDELWTYVGNKANKMWLFYAYHRTTGEMISWVWGKRDYKTVRSLREKLKKLGVTFGTIYTDDFSSFVKAFKSDNHIIGKKNTVGIEGNNCRLRHRIRRAFRKTCCFSKKVLNHLKAFQLAICYINFGHV